ncbi:MAG: TPM domain-containing protein [Proteobacteria bacterium]|nr:TPM domain-containing protein [Pseudomonadota bacterium]
MGRRAIFTAIAWVCLTVAGAAQTPVFPALSGRVVDGAGLLGAADRASLTQTLAALEAKTTDQLVVVTLKSLQGRSIEEYGYQLGRHWQIGQKDKNNGALLIVAPAERAVRIEVGYGLEGTLTDAISRYIIETTILPRFKAGDYPDGIKRGVDDIVRVLAGEAEALRRAAAQYAASGMRPSGADQPLWPAIAVGLAVVGLLIFCAVAGGAACRDILWIIFLMLRTGGGGSSSGGRTSWSGGGGSFGGGGSSGRW